MEPRAGSCVFGCEKVTLVPGWEVGLKELIRSKPRGASLYASTCMEYTCERNTYFVSFMSKSRSTNESGAIQERLSWHLMARAGLEKRILRNSNPRNNGIAVHRTFLKCSKSFE